MVRGIRAGNAEPPRMHDAMADLRRAIQLNPHLRHARLNLAVAMRARAYDQATGGDPIFAGWYI